MPVENTQWAEMGNTATGKAAEAIRFGPEQAIPLFVGFVHPGRYPHEFAWSYAKLLMNLHQRVTVVGLRSGPNISNPRNDLLRAFLQTDNAYFLSLDTDIEFEPEDVDMLLKRSIEHDLPVLGGTYRNRFDDDAEPIIVCSYHLGDGKYGRGEVLPQTEGFLEVAGLGMGFTLIRRDVAEALQPAPLFPYSEMVVSGAAVGATSEENREAAHMLGEDISFCFRARAAGFGVWLDLDVRVRHHKATVID